MLILHILQILWTQLLQRFWNFWNKCKWYIVMFQESSEMDEFPKWEPFNQKYWNSASKIKILECRFRVKFTKKFGLNLWGYPLCWKLKNCGSICYWKFSEKKATSFVEWKALSENWDKSAVWTFLFFNWFKNMWITSALTLNHNPNPYH